MSPLEERLRRPEDAAAIRTLDATHGRQLDDGDWPALVALFTEDGVSDGLSRVQRHHRPGATHPGAVNAALRDHFGDWRRPPMDKVVASAQEAVADIGDGAVLAVGGFGLCGVPFALIDALLEQGTRNLTTISNNCGVEDQALGVLLYAGRIRKTISSFVGGSKEVARLYLSGGPTSTGRASRWATRWGPPVGGSWPR